MGCLARLRWIPPAPSRAFAWWLVRWRARSRRVARGQQTNSLATPCCSEKALRALLGRAPATFASSPESCDSLQTTARGQGLPPRFRGDCMPPPSDLRRTAWCPLHSQNCGGRPSRSQSGQHAIAPVAQFVDRVQITCCMHCVDGTASTIVPISPCLPSMPWAELAVLQTHSRLHAVARWWRSWTASGRTDLPELNYTSPLAV